ncbi:NAD(P)/FAD-dependent oxidoreductase [Thermoflexus hugenholtzii]|uniref:Sulfide:quinone oxidoreductase n=1 Tax=Thermoflexus hugenholtzii JAD2 TaxID=877466 RepID=A0A212R6D0_9CHLR|nr:FAD-dependent oxidoreductase [Thermoflexus hugenholtzii]SNB67619.1 sulfide:quinone oxidoreductase [Thermoflexus hugenholtzii JAD2]
MRRVLILGGGFGGVATAHALRRRLPPEDEIVVVERRPYFMLGLRKTWALIGRGTLEEGRRPLQALERFGIRVLPGTITAIDPANRAVEVNGRRWEGDAMVVALGAELAPEAIPGFREHALNVYDPQEIPRAMEAVRAFRGGQVMIGIFGAPYKCPPAPYEMAFLLQDFFEARGVRARISVFTPQPMSLPVLGAAGCSVLEGRLAERGIDFLPNHKATAVEAGAVIFGDRRRPFDLLLGVPPHRCPEVVVRSGLTDGGAWVRVHPRTLETRFAGVYAIGDITEILLPNGMPLPKAGVFAEAEGEVVAERIAAVFAGREPEASFSGEGFCYLELGRGEAMLVRGRFLVEPAPEIELTEPSPNYLEEKKRFEAERLRTWFGDAAA